MKLKKLSEVTGVEKGEVIAQFGDATLLKTWDGKWRLRGGQREDRLAAKEWISLFLHEAAVGVD